MYRGDVIKIPTHVPLAALSTCLARDFYEGELVCVLGCRTIVLFVFGVLLQGLAPPSNLARLGAGCAVLPFESVFLCFPCSVGEAAQA